MCPPPWNGLIGRASLHRFALEEGLGVAYKGGNMPSSGLLSVYLALQSCGKVDVYGFSMKVNLFAAVPFCSAMRPVQFTAHVPCVPAELCGQELPEVPLLHEKGGDAGNHCCVLAGLDSHGFIRAALSFLQTPDRFRTGR